MASMMRCLGYPKGKALSTAWIDGLASGQHRLRHGPVPEELRCKAVVAVASGGRSRVRSPPNWTWTRRPLGSWKRRMLDQSGEKTMTEPTMKPEKPGKPRKTGPVKPAAEPEPAVRPGGPVASAMPEELDAAIADKIHLEENDMNGLERRMADMLATTAATFSGGIESRNHTGESSPSTASSTITRTSCP